MKVSVLFSHRPVLQSAKINLRENVNEDNNAKINSRENVHEDNNAKINSRENVHEDKNAKINSRKELVYSILSLPLDQLPFERLMRKSAFLQMRKQRRRSASREADQRLYFRYTESTIPLLYESEISSLKPSSVVVQLGLCQTWSETPKTDFPTTRLVLPRINKKQEQHPEPGHPEPGIKLCSNIHALVWLEYPGLQEDCACRP